MSLKRSASGSSSEEEANRSNKRRATGTGSTAPSLAGTELLVASALQEANNSSALHHHQSLQLTNPGAASLQAFGGLNATTNHHGASSSAGLLDSLRLGSRGVSMSQLHHQDGLHHSSLLSSPSALGMTGRTLSQEHIQALLGGSSFPAPTLSSLQAHAHQAATSSFMGGFDAETQQALLASRLRQAQAGLGLNPNYASLLPSTGHFPSSSALALSSLGSMPGGLESQLRSAQLMALQSQMSAASPHSHMDPAHQMMLASHHQQVLSAPSTSGTAPSSAGSSTPQPSSAETSTRGSKSRSMTASPSTKKKEAPKETLLAVAGALPPAIPPAVEGSTPHYEERVSTIISMATDEDQNWLSEFQCFIRREILEIFRASAEDVQIRNNSKTLQTQQIGIRCRFCAHLPPGSRASRSSAFPSSIPQIYQSFTMMLRDHWTACQSIPSPQKEKFLEFKTKNNQGASDSKNYWMHAARRTGMVNTAKGIQIDNASRAAAARIPPFGTNSDTNASLMLEREDTEPLVVPEDKELLHDQYWFVLMQQVQRVRLSASERVGNRKSLRIGLPGFGCRYCCQSGRLGLSRIFPARRRTLPSKIPDIHDHLRRCPLCPQAVKDQLEELTEQRKHNQGEADDKTSAYSAGREKEFFTRIWSRLGHGNKPEPS